MLASQTFGLLDEADLRARPDSLGDPRKVWTTSRWSFWLEAVASNTFLANWRTLTTPAKLKLSKCRNDDVKNDIISVWNEYV